MKETVYYVKRYNVVTQRTETIAEVTDPAKAYDLAIELDCASKFGKEEDGSDRYGHACVIAIEDEDGNSRWQECSEARCPSVGMFV